MINQQSQVDDFPLHVLPEPVQEVVMQIHYEKQAPIGVIASVVLGVMSLACQDSFDIEVKENLRFAVSLYLLVLAESGERKSAVTQMLMEVVYKLQSELDQEYATQQKSYLRNLALWQAKDSALIKAISKATQKGLDTQELDDAWHQCQEQKPIAPTHKKLVLTDVTSAAIKAELGKGWPSLMVMSDEAGSLLRGDLFKDTAINSMWSGHPISIERASTAGYKIEDYRLGIMLQLQPGVYRNIQERLGEHARSSGLSARFLTCSPPSTQGQRFNHGLSQNRYPYALANFNHRTETLLKEGFIRRERKVDRKCLRLTPEALSRWNQHYDQIESQIGPSGQLKDFRDHASKFMEHVARLAGVIEAFTTRDAEQVSDYTMYAAIDIASYYGNHFIQQMKMLDKNQEPSDADLLLSWLIDNIRKNGGLVYKKNHILQFGPRRLRNKKILNAALQELEVRRRIIINKIYRMTTIHLLISPNPFSLRD